MRRKIELGLVLLLLAGVVFGSQKLSERVASGKVTNETNEANEANEITADKQVIVVDPGHGGSDPGKVGVNHALEKDLNLEIAKKVQERLKKQGFQVIMTRETDEMLGNQRGENKKAQDMKARVKLINESKASIVISIHQNSYQEGSIKGAQVFYYSHSAEGEKAAKIMQESLLSFDPENTRQAKANDTYYLLKKTEVPAIIVESCFLSNYEEAEKIITEEYQRQVADAICKGVSNYLEK